MNLATQQRLLALNRGFYAQVAPEFDRTRAGLAVGWQALYKHLPRPAAGEPVWVLDVGCGNGRFARALEELARDFAYVGVDSDAALLTRAADQTADLIHTRTHFVRADLAEPGWTDRVRQLHAQYDVVVCLATLHHLPGYTLRLDLVKTLAALVKPVGVLIFSNWQFLTSERFAQKQIDWGEIGLSAQDVEPGDALLPWQQGGYAVRYVHQIDEGEMARLAREAKLIVIDSFYADGKEGNLNLYSVCQRLEIGD